MANFPSNPSNGNTHTIGNTIWVYNSTSDSWLIQDVNEYAVANLENTPPANPDEGTIWYDSQTTGRLYIYIDGNWIDASPGDISVITGGNDITATKSGTTYTLNVDDSFVRNTGDTMTGELQLNARLDVGDGSGNDTEIRIFKADNNVSDHLQFYNGTTRVGEIGAQDNDWLRINQSTDKNIYTPRYIRADAGFFVDGTSKGINGSGNFVGGTIAGASDVSVSAGNNTIVQRHSSGYIFANYFNTTPNTVGSGVTQICVETGNDGYIRHGTAAAVRSFLNVADGATAGGGGPNYASPQFGYRSTDGTVITAGSSGMFGEYKFNVPHNSGQGIMSVSGSGSFITVTSGVLGSGTNVSPGSTTGRTTSLQLSASLNATVSGGSFYLGPNGSLSLDVNSSGRANCSVIGFPL
jgi:hypothetical protein